MAADFCYSNQLSDWRTALTDKPTFTGVYAITSEQLLAGPELIDAVDQALLGGVSIVQYRNKSAGFARRVAEANLLKAICHSRGAALLINDDIDLCQAVDADGVHLGQSDAGIQQARQRLGWDAIIGITCHNSADLAGQAERNLADYVAVGRFFPSKTKPQASIATIDDLRRVRAATTLPIVAIGGITADNGGQLIDAGADMLAVIHYLFADPGVEARASALSGLFKNS